MTSGHEERGVIRPPSRAAPRVSRDGSPDARLASPPGQRVPFPGGLSPPRFLCSWSGGVQRPEGRVGPLWAVHESAVSTWPRTGDLGAGRFLGSLAICRHCHLVRPCRGRPRAPSTSADRLANAGPPSLEGSLGAGAKRRPDQ